MHVAVFHLGSGTFGGVLHDYFHMWFGVVFARPGWRLALGLSELGMVGVGLARLEVGVGIEVGVGFGVGSTLIEVGVGLGLGRGWIEPMSKSSSSITIWSLLRRRSCCYPSL